MKLIGIVGKKRVGKDTVAQMIKSIIPTMSYALSYPVKVGLSGGFGGVKVSIDNKVRHLTYEDFDGTSDINRESTLDIPFSEIAKCFAIGFKVVGRDLQSELGGKEMTQIMTKISETYSKNNGLSIRQLMQIFATDIGCDHLDKTLWLGFFMETYMKAFSSGKYEAFVVTDIRQQHEIDLFRQLGAEIVHIDKPDDKTCINKDIHITEIGLGWNEGEFIISNDGSLDELYDKVKQLIG